MQCEGNPGARESKLYTFPEAQCVVSFSLSPPLFSFLLMYVLFLSYGLKKWTVVVMSWEAVLTCLHWLAGFLHRILSEVE